MVYASQICKVHIQDFPATPVINFNVCVSPPPQESPIVAISLTDSPGYLVSSKNTCLLQAGKAKPLNDAAAVALLKSGGWGGSLGVCFAVGVRVCVRQCAGK